MFLDRIEVVRLANAFSGPLRNGKASPWSAPVLLAIVLLTSSGSAQRTIHVPADVSTIQGAIQFALGTMRFAAAALGWKIRLLDRVGSAAVAKLLGLDRKADYIGAEREHPELLALVGREKWASDQGLCLSKELATQVIAEYMDSLVVYDETWRKGRRYGPGVDGVAVPEHNLTLRPGYHVS